MGGGRGPSDLFSHPDTAPCLSRCLRNRLVVIPTNAIQKTVDTTDGVVRMGPNLASVRLSHSVPLTASVTTLRTINHV